MTRQRKTTREKKFEITRKLMELEEEYGTLLYLETMPKYDPVYKYCYATSNFTLTHEQQSVDSWLRAIARHMSKRIPGHGGAKTDAEIVSIPCGLSDAAIERWIEYVTKKLRVKAKRNSKIQIVE